MRNRLTGEYHNNLVKKWCEDLILGKEAWEKNGNKKHYIDLKSFPEV